MIIYNVTVNVDDDVHEDWFKWMSDVHIKDVMATGLFVEARFSKILAEEEGGKSYSIQYLCNSMEDLEIYQQDHAAALQQDHAKRYHGKFVAFRTLLRVDKQFK